MFSRNGANVPESKTKTTRMFYLVGDMAAPGAKSAVSECFLLNLKITFSVF